MPAATAPRQLSLEQCAATFVDDPLGFVLFAYPWGQAATALALEDGPDTWQVDVLGALEDALLDPDHAGAIRLAVASGNGVGKGALTAWLVQWFVTTRVKPQIVVTANTKSQLDTKTWREVAKWHGMSRFRHWYTWTKTAYYRTGHHDTWFAAAIPWNEHKPEAFAGTHDRHVLIVADEASILPDTICDAIEGSLTTPGAICVMLGNPTRNTGRFKEIFPGGRLAHRWRTSQVDSRSAKHADQELIQQWIQDYSIDSDFVRVRVLGQFPRQAVGQFISEETVREAQARTAPVDPLAPTIIGVDVARFGDDRSCLVVRRGGQLLEVKTWRELTTVQLAGYVCEVMDQYRAEQPTVCIDGVGLGAGVVDVCRARGYRVEEVLAGGKALDSTRYFNVRAESWDGMRQWLETRGALPANQDLVIDLCAPEYQYNDKGQLPLERKEHMKSRGLASPDLGDALSLTFAVRVAPKSMPKAPAFRVPQGRDAWMA